MLFVAAASAAAVAMQSEHLNSTLPHERMADKARDLLLRTRAAAVGLTDARTHERTHARSGEARDARGTTGS